MDKYRHTDGNQELDDISRLILELKDLSGDDKEPADRGEHRQSVRKEEPAVQGESLLPEELIAPAKKSAVKKRINEPSKREQPEDYGQRLRKKPVTSSKRKMLPLWAVALIDILVGGAVILTFALFHHVLPAMISAQLRQETPMEVPVIATEAATEAPVQTATEVPVEIVTEMPTEPDNRTEWQKKFEDHFSDEIIITDNSYKSPNVSITVETISYGEGRNKQTFHVADIYIGSIENFTAYTANNAIRSYDTQEVLEMCQATNALIAIGGDFITYQKGGFLIRNSKVHLETTNNVSICALFPDGTIETYDAKRYTIEEIKSRNPLQVWSFGPALLDENGQVRAKYDVPRAISHNNPRSAIGYYEPGHYCFVVVDGRQDGYAKGMTIPELAQIFADRGCSKAYNLDGGGSAVMAFNNRIFSKQSNGGRDLGDILLIRENPETTVSGEGIG